MMIDIDHFKLFNDRYRQCVATLVCAGSARCCRSSPWTTPSSFARYGDDEFALLLPGLEIARAAALAEEARRAIEDLLIAHDEAPCGFVTISIGVDSLVPATDQSADRSGRRRRRRLYAAKRRGRNTVVTHFPMLLNVAS